jgi:DNA-binding response OmpR family regulator
MRQMLVIDDERVITLAIKNYFTRLGSAVDTAAEREEAEALLATRRYDVVIADVRLEGMDGREGLDILRFVRERCLDARVVLMTAYPSDSTEATARHLGVDAFLKKPVPLQHMANVVDSLLRVAR